MATTETQRTDSHVLTRFSGAVLEAFDRVHDAPAWSLTAEEARTTLVDLDQVVSRAQELRLRVLAEGERLQVGADSGASSTAAWVAHKTRQTRAAARRDVRLAESLESRFGATREALSRARINLEQARVIVAAVTELDEDTSADLLSPGDLVRAEEWLVAAAAEHDAKRLRVLGRRIFEVLCPETAEQREGEKLAEQESAARRRARLRFRDNGDGTWSGSFTISDLHAAMWRRLMEAMTAPRRMGQDRRDAGTGTWRPTPELMGQAMGELLERIPPGWVPQAGGVNATVVVTMTLEQLLDGLGVATLDDGTRISAGEARRLACNAGIIPMVLGGDSVPLDLGRQRRLHTRYQRLAMAQRDGGCRAESCDRPPSWCEAHHEVPWSQGGPTDVEHGGLRCHHHHRLEHDTGYTSTRLPDGSVRYHRRT